MLRDTAVSSDTVKRQLRRIAEDSYGADRAGELAEQIDHTAQMMQRVAAQELPLAAHPPTSPSRRGKDQS
jgi:hypothetical protein